LQHRAGVRSYTSSFDLAKSYVFIKQSPLPLFLYLRNFTFNRPSFSRSYGINLPSSFNTIHPYAFIF